MNLREPKRKRRVKLKEQPPFPIIIGNKDEWATYTAHLTELGSCIIEPNEIVAIHSMVIIMHNYHLYVLFVPNCIFNIICNFFRVFLVKVPCLVVFPHLVKQDLEYLLL